MDLSHFLFVHSRKTRPDGRPLYAYKCTDKFYIKIKAFMLNQFQVTVKKKQPPLFSILFCLYAAETWRRKHESGTWKWETIFKEISATTPSHASIHEWVKNGLHYWERDILSDKNGKNLYLVTIACEGGLPLLLLRKENAKLNRFFKNLLEQYHYKRQLPDCNINKIAQKLSFSLLPQSLCNDIVCKLSSDLVQKVVNLQEKVRDSDKPIAALDSYYPHWRDALPLSLEDKTIELLLNDLVIDAKKLSTSIPKNLQWQLFLVQKKNRWCVEKRLHLSTTISGSVLKQWIQKKDLPYRMRVLLETSEGIEPLALMTHMYSENKDRLFRCELLNPYHKKHNSIIVSGNKILENLRLILTDGTFESELQSARQDLGDLPWIFHEHNDQLKFIGEGSINASSELLTILSPSGGKWSTNDNVIDFITHIDDMDRDMYQVMGTCEWNHPEHGKCLICSSSQSTSNDILMIQGKKIRSTIDRDPPFLGMPDLYKIDQHNVIQKDNNLQMEWAPSGTGNLKWNSDPTHCSGPLWVRYINSSGYQVLRRKIRVVPNTTQVNIVQTGVNEHPGVIEIKGLSNIEINCADTRCTYQRQADHHYEIYCLAKDNQLKTDFTVRLEWPDFRYIDLHLPFPCAGAAFLCGEKHILSNERIAISRLSAIIAVAQAASVNQKFFIHITIKTREKLFSTKVRKTQYRYYQDFEFQEPFCLEKDGRHIFYLHRIQERIKSLLSLTGDIDSTADIKIKNIANQMLAEIEVGTFDLWFERKLDEKMVTIHKDCSNVLKNHINESIFVNMLPLWDPEISSTELIRTSDETWKIPDNLMPGPYWIVGDINKVARFRPILWTIPGQVEKIKTQIEEAIRSENATIRKSLQNQWVKSIATDPNHPEWTLFFKFLQMVGPYPASALDFFSCMIESPEAMVMALLKSNDDDFEAVWLLSYQLPFSWYLVPAKAWLSSVRLYIQSIQEELSSIDLDPDGELLFSFFESFQNRLIIRRPFFKQICDWLCMNIFPEKQLQGSELQIASIQPEFIENNIKDHEHKFQGRYGADEHYPTGPEVLKWTDSLDFPDQHKYLNLSHHMRAIRCAPFVAAYICLKGEIYSQQLLFEIKKIRHFDKEWFSQAYAGALCLGLSKKTT
jgi:hypothetical protein